MADANKKGVWHGASEEYVRSSDGGVGQGGRGTREPYAGEGFVRQGSRHNRVRHFGRRFGRHSHSGHFGISAPLTGALDGYRRRHQQLVRDQCGQATVEYVVLLAGFACVVWGLGSLWRLFESGLVVDQALLAASHQVRTTAMGLVDAFVF